MKKHVLVAMASLAFISSASFAKTTVQDLENSAQDQLQNVVSFGSEGIQWLKDKYYYYNNHTDICMVTGSEKAPFLNKIKGKFQDKYNTTVHVISMGSLEGAKVAVSGGAATDSKTGDSCVPVIWSPASSAYEQMVKHDLARAGRSYLLVAPQTVTSPLVLVLRGRAYRALKKANPNIFKKEGDREYFTFQSLADMEAKGTKVIVTRPGKSNSGFLSLLLAVHEATNQASDSVSPDDVSDSGLKIADAFFSKATIPAKPEDSAGFNSSGDLYQKLFSNDANAAVYQGAVTYESLVVQDLSTGGSGLHVLYPETNVISDHPAYVLSPVVAADASDDDKSKIDHQVKLAEKFLAYILGPDQQKEAVAEGFRPGVTKAIADISVTQTWPEAVFGAGIQKDLGDDSVIATRKIDGETIEAVKDAAAKYNGN
jgi:ABC-type Fe3+ transport system substrate-binding protein